MPRFRVLCSTTKYYRLMVEAPSMDAVKSFIDSDYSHEHSEFHPDDEEGWDLVSIREVAPKTLSYEGYEGVPPDVRVGSGGEPIEAAEE